MIMIMKIRMYRKKKSQIKADNEQQSHNSRKLIWLIINQKAIVCIYIYIYTYIGILVYLPLLLRYDGRKYSKGVI